MHSAPAHGAHGADLTKLALGALGVVYGDIGTSPLYALKECVTPPHGVSATPDNILGLLSLVFWSITFVVSIKYLLFVMRADNDGEGGVLALMALALGTHDAKPHPRARTLVILGLFGAALLYGDGVITPAISVLSAVEGLTVATDAFTPVVVPITCIILIALFVMQKRGTGGIGYVFGPITLIWFGCIGSAGVPWILRHPHILTAVNPLHAVRFFAAHGKHGFLVLGSVVLCITGGEALYADMGHFGTRAIRVAWYSCVFPALLLNYFGQGAMLLERPEAASNPFYAMIPAQWLYPMVVLATLATVVASQALISGAFSLTRQAVQLGYLPRVTIIHTSGKTEGQIYVPEVNALLMVACVALVLGFRQSSELADAYGIAVTGTMAITSMLFYSVAHHRWGWSVPKAGVLLALFLTFDLSFFAACSAKIAHGGWFPLLVAVAIFTTMMTWKLGRRLLGEKITADSLPLEAFLEDIDRTNPYRVAGTAVFLTSIRRGTPAVLLHHFKHNKVLHQQVVILSIVTDAVPEVPAADFVHIKFLDRGFWAVTAHYGFMQTPDVIRVLRACAGQGLYLNEAETSFYLGRETLLTGKGRGMSPWRKRLFRFLSRNARSATDFFSIPPNRVVEIGTQIEL
ncbi:MAG TPA: potassium transporter Kup [Polyangia bacterium]|jgi:KUP system potassium uptake protein|nr:potassium transporter Kup [Polyangia bacterium]